MHSGDRLLGAALLQLQECLRLQDLHVGGLQLDELLQLDFGALGVALAQFQLAKKQAPSPVFGLCLDLLLHQHDALRESP